MHGIGASFDFSSRYGSLLAGLVAAVATCVGTGCTATSPDSDEARVVEPSEEEVLREYLDSSGYDTSRFDVMEDLGLISLGSDVAFSVDDVREQLYGEKGYDYFGVYVNNLTTPSGTASPYTVRKIHSSVRGDIKLVFETPQTHWWATDPVNVFWQAAFTNAAQQWSDASTQIDISESNQGAGVGASIHVMMTTRTFCDSDGDGDNDCVAQGAFPGYGFPGRFILVDPSKTVDCPGGWIPNGCSGGGCFTRMLRLALHELGHNLGFPHPGCGSHISGTQSDSSCSPNNVSYDTVMSYDDWCAENGLLKTDDIISMNKTY